MPTLQRACATADVDLSEIDGVAVTVGPGLMGALVVGLASAKALAYALNKPLYGVNHLVGHVAVDLLEHGPLPQRCMALLVSGGHTSLLHVTNIVDSIAELGSTIDDAAGEAYDKVARVLGLPYPGGPYIDKAATGDPDFVRFPRGLTARKDLERHRFDFSISGLKTAVARWVEARQRDGLDIRHGRDRLADRRRRCREWPVARVARRTCGRARDHSSYAAAQHVHRQRRHDRGAGCGDRGRRRQANCPRHWC